MSGINQSLKEKITKTYSDLPETNLAILALELAEKHKDDRDVIKQKIDTQIKIMIKSNSSKGEK